MHPHTSQGWASKTSSLPQLHQPWLSNRSIPLPPSSPSSLLSTPPKKSHKYGSRRTHLPSPYSPQQHHFRNKRSRSRSPPSVGGSPPSVGGSYLGDQNFSRVGGGGYMTGSSSGHSTTASTNTTFNNKSLSEQALIIENKKLQGRTLTAQEKLLDSYYNQIKSNVIEEHHSSFAPPIPTSPSLPLPSPYFGYNTDNYSSYSSSSFPSSLLHLPDTDSTRLSTSASSLPLSSLSSSLPLSLPSLKEERLLQIKDLLKQIEVQILGLQQEGLSLQQEEISIRESLLKGRVTGHSEFVNEPQRYTRSIPRPEPPRGPGRPTNPTTISGYVTTEIQRGPPRGPPYQVSRGQGIPSSSGFPLPAFPSSSLSPVQTRIQPRPRGRGALRGS